MRTRFTTALLASLLCALPAAGFGATPVVRSATTKPASARPAATHATRGVVTSIDASTLVIARNDAKHSAMTFALSPATARQGTIAVGEQVSVRYREDGKAYVATAVGVRSGTHQPAHGTMPKK